MQAVSWRKWGDLTSVKSVNLRPESIKSDKSNKENRHPGSPSPEGWGIRALQAGGA